MFGYVEERADFKALSFVDDVDWWAERRHETEVARKLTNAATYAVEWASENAVALDVEKTEAMEAQNRVEHRNPSGWSDGEVQ